ncbi:MAG: zinc ABC transporter substrate-binding protein [Oscillospiraceae bacterium]|nr:zinc ABC transporter substrate-binding protein [Oscillospiraceae bacterium]
MKRTLSILLSLLLLCLWGCAESNSEYTVAATTAPVYCFTDRLCENTPVEVKQVVTEPVSCLHDYSLQVGQMRILESADLVVISGAGLEGFLDDALTLTDSLCDAGSGLTLICTENHGHDHDHGDGHDHSHDSHTWLSPKNAAVMAQNICRSLSAQFPEYSTMFESNLSSLLADLSALQAYGEATLSDLATRELITFHDGFAYFAQAFDLTILESVEEESGSEASASDLIGLITLVREHRLPAIFTEINGSDAAAAIIAHETGVKTYSLSMAMSGDYFTQMYRNIDTVKEALG